ncbi:MAG: MFS transporter [Candidatus Dadabacteria bacterium]|nr:MAG: MFS transporter [Candidatus Dadabacteria bacterium]
MEKTPLRSLLLLSATWFFLIGALGLFFPFYSLYLSANAGLSGSQVGLVMAMIPLVGIVAQPLWGRVADLTGSRKRVFTLVTAGAAAGYSLLYYLRGFAQLAAGTAALALFSSAAIPTCVALSMALLRRMGPHAFGLVRAWGTFGFLIAVAGFPRFLAWLGKPVTGDGPRDGLGLILPLTAVLTLVAGLVAIALPRDEEVTVRARAGDWRLLAGDRAFVRLLAFMLASYFFLQGPIALFPIFVRSLGGSVEMVSRMWIFMLALEIPLVALSGTGLRWLGPRGLVALGVGSGAIRWLVSGTTEYLPLVYGVQVLHGVTVMGLIVGGPLYVEAVVPARLRATGQAMLSTVGMGLGGILSNLACGWLIDHVGPAAPALFGGAGAAVLTATMGLLVPPPRKVVHPDDVPVAVTPDYR